MSKRILNKLFVVALIIAACVIMLEFWSNSNNSIQAQTEASKLTLELSTSKSNYFQLEPVEFNFKLSNSSVEPVKWQGLLILGSDLDFLIKSPGSEENRIEGRKMSIGTVASAPSVIQPGGEFISNAILGSVEEQEKVFPEPGTYQVRVEFNYKEITAEEVKQIKIASNPVTIHISAPQGVNLEAYNYIKNTLEKARSERVSADEMLRLRRNFVNNYRGSVYAKYEILKLALAYRAGGEDLKALRELCKISNENFNYSKQVQKTMQLIYVKLSPPDLTPLPPDAPIPQRPHPCVWLQSQPNPAQ